MTEIWEPHPIYPHEGSSLGRARTLGGDILTKRPNNRPKDAPPGQRYQLIDIWYPHAPCYQENGKWIHLKKQKRCRCRKTVSAHTFITECHWGLKTHRRKVARHRHGASPASAAWDDLLGWGWPEDNEHDKPEEIRIAAAKTARAAQLAGRPKPRRRWWQRVADRSVRHRPWSRRKPKGRPVTAGQTPISKPITKGAP